MAANYTRTKPIDPLWYRADRTIWATCRCGRRQAIRIGDLIKRGLDPELRLYQVVPRLRCSGCGRREPSISIDR